MSRLEVVTGDGTVLRFGDICLWAGLGASPALLQFLDQSARNLAPSARGGQLLADHVVGVLHQHDPEPDAPFVALGPEEGGTIALLLHGPVQVWDGLRWLSPPAEPGWLRTSTAPAPVLVAGAAGGEPVPGRSHPLLDLESGVVPGGGFALVDATAAIPVPPAPDATAPPVADVPVAPSVPAPPVSVAFPAPDRDPTDVLPAAGGAPWTPQQGNDDDTVLSAFTDLTAVVPAASGDEPTTVMAASGAPTPDEAAYQRELQRPPGVFGLLPPPGGLVPAPPVGPGGAVPVVRGVRCVRGHFNHPDTKACVVCGLSVDRSTAVSGPRPPLGILVVDDGSVYSLERPYLLGAAVAWDPSVANGSVRALTLAGDRLGDTHAEIRLDGWAVSLVDRGTPGGTHVLAPGQDGWSRISAHREVPLRPGTHVALGSRVLTYVSPWPG